MKNFLKNSQGAVEYPIIVIYFNKESSCWETSQIPTRFECKFKNRQSILVKYFFQKII